MRQLLQIALLFAFASAAAGQAQTQPLTAKAAVGSNTAFVGEPITFQIQISGSEKPANPNLGALTDFTVKPNGGGANSSSQVTIINGQVTQNVHRGYNFNYQIIPKREGTLIIPAIQVQAEGRVVQTQPIQIIVSKPAETENFKLRAVISKPQSYVGEPLILEWTFLYNAEIDARSTNITMPVLDIPDFFFYDLEVPGGNRAATLDGKQYQTLRLRKALIPQKLGQYQIPPSSLTFRGLAGYKMAHDFFGRPVKQKQYKSFVIPSNPLALQVLDVPLQGRPANFGGHVGIYQIQAAANPTQVNVGDPITLTIAISGPEYLEHVNLPPLSKQPALAQNFRLPNEIAAGQIQDRAKVFTQTIRAANEKVSQIPPIELPFFNTQTGTYQVAKSAAIPLFVRPTKVVTAGDAEGIEPILGQTNALQAWTRGIAHNYEGPAALRHQAFEIRGWFGSLGFIAMIGLPPLAYMGLFAMLLLIRKRRSDPKGVRERRAMREFSTQLSKAENSDAVLETLRAYLGNKLRLASGALTFKDVQEPLKKKGVADETITAIRDVFDECEASRYAGGSSNVDELVEKSRQIASAVEKTMSKGRGLGVRSSVGLFVALLLTIPGLLRAELSETEISSLFQQGNELFRQANAVSAQDARQAQDLYGKSILRFERIVREGGVRNGQLFYNIGNAYFRTNDIGRAILNYRRAEQLMPHDPNLHQNLNYARMRRADKIEEEPKKRVMQTIFFWHFDFSAQTRAIMFGITFVLVWVAAGTKLVFPRPFLKWVIGVAGVIAALFLGSLVASAATAGKTNPGVIISAEVTARKGDSETYEPSFQKPLHAGTEFNVIEARADWLQVVLGDGEHCWLPARAVELVEVQPRVLSAGRAM